jgi:hypothetical protein
MDTVTCAVRPVGSELEFSAQGRPVAVGASERLESRANDRLMQR